mgnify:CR=1 FL=1
MNMDEKTQKEYDRIWAGPHEGEFSLLHHQGPIVEHSDNVMERVAYILQEKPVEEQYDRLRHIYFVPADVARVWNAAMAEPDRARNAAMAEADRARKAARAEPDRPILALIPNCSWDGRTIFGEKP